MNIEPPLAELATPAFTAADFLLELHRRGATQLRRITFRNNRSTVWSLTRDGSVLNLHRAYQGASPEIFDAFATIVRDGGVASPESSRAWEFVREWPALAPAIEAARSRHNAHRGRMSGRHCCATPDQRAYLRALYFYFNRTRFEDALPLDIPVRLSSRMRSALGHMLPGEEGGERCALEIALNVDLMHEGNGAERVDTLLHEMAHVADYLSSGHRGHGRSWKTWARRVGCRPTTLYDRPVVRRLRRRQRVTRVPPLPRVLLPLLTAIG